MQKKTHLTDKVYKVNIFHQGAKQYPNCLDCPSVNQTYII